MAFSFGSHIIFCVERQDQPFLRQVISEGFTPVSPLTTLSSELLSVSEEFQPQSQVGKTSLHHCSSNNRFIALQGFFPECLSITRVIRTVYRIQKFSKKEKYLWKRESIIESQEPWNFLRAGLLCYNSTGRYYLEGY